jgi:hypothetical protein
MRRLAVAAIIAIITSTTANAAEPVLPNSVATPGAINPAVTQANIASTICTLGFTQKIRPPVTYTTALKKHQLRTAPYSAYGSTDIKLFEEDHLISLELGGNPTSPKNLWPEPWTSARIKDRLENTLHAMVCAHQITLKDAQSQIANNWYAAYQAYVVGRTAKP